MKKSTPKPESTESKQPKTALDEKFLSVATQVMKARGLTSDRAISLELGRGPDFINKVRRGLQSAPPDAWDTLLSKYPEANAINQSQNSGIAQTGNNSTATQHNYSISDCEKERDGYKAERDEANSKLAQVEQERAAVARELEVMKELVKAKDETIMLLKGGYNRPN